jgi:WD40 repeat protein
MSDRMGPECATEFTGRQTTVRIWDAASGEEIASLKGGYLAFSPDGVRVVTLSGDGTARIWDAASREEIAPLEASLLP